MRRPRNRRQKSTPSSGVPPRRLDRADLVPPGLLPPGEPVLLIDRRRRRYLIHLRPGGTSDLRGGKVSHDALIGQDEGGTTTSTRGERLLVVRPTLADFVLEMPRGAQVVYPKDLGAILVAA